MRTGGRQPRPAARGDLPVERADDLLQQAHLFQGALLEHRAELFLRAGRVGGEARRPVVRRRRHGFAPPLHLRQTRDDLHQLAARFLVTRGVFLQGFRTDGNFGRERLVGEVEDRFDALDGLRLRGKFVGGHSRDERCLQKSQWPFSQK